MKTRLMDFGNSLIYGCKSYPSGAETVARERVMIGLDFRNVVAEFEVKEISTCRHSRSFALVDRTEDGQALLREARN